MFFTRRGAHSDSQAKRKSITRVREMGKFSSLTPDEIENKLEQLRALDNNIKINVALASKAPIGVDTEEDLVKVSKMLS